MKLFLHPNLTTNLGSFSESNRKVKKAIDIIPYRLPSNQGIVFPLNKIQMGKYSTYWNQGLNKFKFINSEDDLLYNEILEFLSEDDLWVHSIAKRIEHLNILKSNYHVKFKSSYSRDMAKLYTYGYLKLESKITTHFDESLLIKPDYDRYEKLQLVIQKITDELIQSFQNLIRDFNYPHNEFVKEVITKYDSDFEFISVKTFALVDVETFETHVDEIVQKLLGKFISPETETEQIEQIFSGSIEELYPIKWVQSANHLNYFLRRLKSENKITTGNYFKLAEGIFIDSYGKPFLNLKNNHSIPQFAMDLDKIVSLF